MHTVTIYKVTCTKGYVASVDCGTRYSLLPWGSNTIEYEGYDDGGKDYVLPDDCEVSGDVTGMPHIYHGDRVCDLILHTSGRPQLVIDLYNMPLLELAGKI